MEKTLIEGFSTERSLAFSNLSKKAYRTLSLVLLLAISSTVLFASLILTSSLKAGITGLRSRLGADLLVVPEGYEKGAENVLISGEPNYFYMDKKNVETIQNLPGVEKASGQFYLTSLSESCCDFPVQIIGFDKERDFTVQSWSKNPLNQDSSGEFVLSGSNVNLTKGKIKFFGQEHRVSARLSKSGTGMDNSIFCDMESLQRIFQDAKEKGFSFISDGDAENKVSTILVKVSEGASAEAVSLKIKDAVAGVEIIKGEKFLKNFSERISSFTVFFYLMSILILLTTMISLALVFSVTINERLREFSILRVIGAKRSQLRKILFIEAAFIGFSGSLTGIAFTSLFLIPFNVHIAEKISLPFAMSNPSQILIFAAVTLILCTASCVISSVNGAIRLSRVEPYGGIK